MRKKFLERSLTARSCPWWWDVARWFAVRTFRRRIVYRVPALGKSRGNLIKMRGINYEGNLYFRYEAYDATRERIWKKTRFQKMKHEEKDLETYTVTSINTRALSIETVMILQKVIYINRILLCKRIIIYNITI